MCFFFFFPFVTKQCKNTKKVLFWLGNVCKAPVPWSKYTTCLLTSLLWHRGDLSIHFTATLLAKFFSIKVKFLLESGNTSLYLWHQSWVIIRLLPINGQKHEYFGLTWLVIIIIVQNIGIWLEVESNIGPLFDLLFNPQIIAQYQIFFE